MVANQTMENGIFFKLSLLPLSFLLVSLKPNKLLVTVVVVVCYPELSKDSQGQIYFRPKLLTLEWSDISYI
jgi:hypothetical protein